MLFQGFSVSSYQNVCSSRLISADGKSRPLWVSSKLTKVKRKTPLTFHHLHYLLLRLHLNFDSWFYLPKRRSAGCVGMGPDNGKVCSVAGKYIPATRQIGIILIMYNCSTILIFFLTGVRAGGRSSARRRGQKGWLTPGETLLPTTTAGLLPPKSSSGE